MAKISTKKEGNNKLYWIIPIILFMTYKGYQIYKKKDGSSSAQNVENLLSKEEHLLTVAEWKKIADYRAEEFYELNKNLSKDDKSYAIIYQNNSDYNNNWVRYRDGLDERANLNYEQREMLKDYWHKKREEITEKVKKIMEENDRKLRPNREDYDITENNNYDNSIEENATNSNSVETVNDNEGADLSQETNSNSSTEVVNSPSYFIGGDEALYNFISKNINYPAMEKDAGISGTVTVSFDVLADGSVSNCEILKGVKGGPGLDKEALRVFQLLPKFQPEIKDGIAVSSKKSYPIKFALR
jgi:TonB family protein